MRTLVLSLIVAALLASAGGTVIWGSVADGEVVVWGS
jgi:hypothetical protein